MAETISQDCDERVAVDQSANRFPDDSMFMNVDCSLSVSIVVYGHGAKDSTASHSVLRDAIVHLADSPACETILVLDNSPIPAFCWTREVNSKVLYIHFSGSNLGYGRGHNIARYLTSCKYHLILNPDILFIQKSLISSLLEIMETEQGIAMIQPLIVYPGGTDIQYLCKENPTFLSQLGRGLLGSLYKRFLARYERWYVMRDLAYGNQPVESQYLSGCFMLCRRSCLDQVDWFDPRFFMYLEDADLTRRLSAVGRCVHEPRVRVGHVWAKGSHRDLRLRVVAIISYFRYALKWGFRLI